MLKRFMILAIASLLVVGALAACGGSSDSNDNGSSSSSAGGASVTLDMTEMKFTPDTFTVKAGEEVTVKLENKGSVKHDFSIDDVDGKKVVKDVDAGKSDTVTFTAPSEAGTLEFYCNQPGHKAAGMHGTITVQ